MFTRGSFIVSFDPIIQKRKVGRDPTKRKADVLGKKEPGEGTGDAIHITSGDSGPGGGGFLRSGHVKKFLRKKPMKQKAHTLGGTVVKKRGMGNRVGEKEI